MPEMVINGGDVRWLPFPGEGISISQGEPWAFIALAIFALGFVVFAGRHEIKASEVLAPISWGALVTLVLSAAIWIWGDIPYAYLVVSALAGVAISWFIVRSEMDAMAIWLPIVSYGLTISALAGWFVLLTTLIPGSVAFIIAFGMMLLWPNHQNLDRGEIASQ